MILKSLLCICHAVGKVWAQYPYNNAILKFQMLYKLSKLAKNTFTFYLCISVLVLSVNKTVSLSNKSKNRQCNKTYWLCAPLILLHYKSVNKNLLSIRALFLTTVIFIMIFIKFTKCLMSININMKFTYAFKRFL